MEICRSCYYFVPKEDRVCKRVFCSALEGNIELLIKWGKIKNEDIPNFKEIVNNIVKEGTEQWKQRNRKLKENKKK